MEEKEDQQQNELDDGVAAPGGEDPAAEGPLAEEPGAGEPEKAAQEPTDTNQCPSCGGEIDIAGLAPFSKIVCPHCEEAVRVRTLLGNFQIKKLLGEGGMSQVFLAEDLVLDRQVALKILHQELTRDASLMAMFEREAKLTASINHPNVVKVYTVGSDGGYFYIAMELVDNISLEERIAKSGAISEREALDLVHDIAAGLGTAYQGGLIHRDIKPGNILLTKDGAGKLVDFGLAVHQGGEEETEELWATPFYVPPEKLDGKPDDFRGDIYSLGATFFHALAGHPPFEANTASLDELCEIKANPVSLMDAGAKVSVVTIRLIDRMMAYKPEARPAGYAELLADIEEIQDRMPGGKASRARRQKALAEKKGGLGAVGWMGIGGGVLAVIALIIIMIARSGNGGGDLSDNIIGDGGDRVLSAGEKAAGARIIEARKMLLAGRFAAAAKEFESLAKDSKDLKQPTLGWTHFNAGVAAMLSGKRPAEVRHHFAEMAKAEGIEEDDDKLSPYAAFFRSIGAELIDPLPVLPDAATALAEDSFESVGLFAYGLKNWDAGEFASALDFFDAFTAANLPSELEWIKSYQSLVEPYRADAERVKRLPKPSMAMSEEELEAIRGRLEAALKEFQTRGGGRRLARRRLERIDGLLVAKKALAMAPPEPRPPVPDPDSGGDPKPPAVGPPMTPGPGGEVVEWTPEAVAERGRFVEALVPVGGAMKDFRFDLAREVVTAFTAETAAMKELRGDYLEALTQAAAFKAKLVTTLASGEFNGKLLRKAGLPIDCRIVGADADKLVVDLMFGPNDLSWAQVDPGWMLERARESWLGDAPTAADANNAGDWIQAAWFARQAGLATEAVQLAIAAGPFAPEFAERWNRLEPLP